MAHYGKFYVKNLGDPDVLEAVTEFDPTASGKTIALVGKCGFEDNMSTGATGENVGVRGVETFDPGTFFLEEASGKTTSSVRVRMVELLVSLLRCISTLLKVGNEISALLTVRLVTPRTLLRLSVVRLD